MSSVLLPGSEARITEPAYQQIDFLIEAMDIELQSWLDLPYAVFGHSMGALLAFEWARKLQRNGHSMPAYLFLSGRRAPDQLEESTLMHTLPDRDIVEEVNRRYDGIPREILDNAEFMQEFLPVLRADFSLVESYGFREEPPLDCPFLVFFGVNDLSITLDQMMRWKRHTRQRFYDATSSWWSFLSANTASSN